jgi:dynamin GTPase
MEAIELSQLSESIMQAAALLADEDVDENSSSSSRRNSTFLNVVALGNVVSDLIYRMDLNFFK